MHQIRFRLGLRPIPCLGSSQRSPDFLTEFKGSYTYKGRDERRKGKGERKRRGEDRAGEGKEHEKKEEKEKERGQRGVDG